MDHRHTHPGPDISNAFKIGILINLIFIAIEVFYALGSKSMALLADAGHNFSDVAALLFSWFAILMARRKPSFRFTYGLRRATIIAALINTFLLFITVGIIVWETASRFRMEIKIQSGQVILVAAAGIIVNGITALLFRRGKEHDLNIKSAFLHFIADMLVSGGVVVGGIAMALTGFYAIDSIVSLIVVAVILYGSYDLLVDSVNLALDAVPKKIDLEAIHEYLSSRALVASIHDLHVWALSTSETALTVHLIVSGPPDENFVSRLTHELRERFHIGHITIQVERAGSEVCETNCH
jgi:cobalt-zinc-cadmium efflux system protein